MSGDHGYVSGLPVPTTAWLEQFKSMQIDDMLIELDLLGEDEFSDEIGECLYGPWPEEERALFGKGRECRHQPDQKHDRIVLALLPIIVSGSALFFFFFCTLFQTVAFVP